MSKGIWGYGSRGPGVYAGQTPGHRHLGICMFGVCCGSRRSCLQAGEGSRDRAPGSGRRPWGLLNTLRSVPLLCCTNPDINELNLPKTCDISFSDPDDLLNFKLVICPDEVRTHPPNTQARAGPSPRPAEGDLAHLPAPAGRALRLSASLPSQGFYKSGKFVFSFKVSLRWAEEATAEAPADTAGRLPTSPLFPEPGGPGLPARPPQGEV